MPTPTDTSTHPWWAHNSTRPYLAPHRVHRRTRRGTATIALLTVALITATGWAITATDVQDVTTEPHGILGHKQTTNALIGGCGRIYTHRTPLPPSGTVPPLNPDGTPNRQTYETIVPMFGPFWDQPAPDDTTFWDRNDPHPPVAENLLANAWDGTMTVYYTEHATPKSLTLLRDILTLRPELDAIAVPWETHQRGPLPQHRTFAFVTWNNSQTCHDINAPALLDFRHAHPANQAPGHDGTPPPALAPDHN